jgi:hypothetical protein
MSDALPDRMTMSPPVTFGSASGWSKVTDVRTRRTGERGVFFIGHLQVHGERQFLKM